MENVFNAEVVIHELLVILNAFIASILAGLVGYERETHKKPAGLRTNMIIAAVAVLLVSLGRGLAMEFESIEGVRVDPIRIIEAIIVGVSFIGAGTIIKTDSKTESKADVQNLTTAATLLFSAGIGVAVALQQYILAVGVTLLALFINLVVKRFMVRLSEDKDPDKH